ncbi:TIR domain-containing protein [Chryseobacterium sp. KCF3-3]|uniref:TIR domain-containing protein n=1 Tax=Chryseobacterium sp. KCF3-3 TaxID=3231511 RepID=UPI0038B3A727
MAYRNGTYVAFHANGTDYPLHSDIKYYNLIKAWSGKVGDNFTIVNSHDKTAAVRDTSSKETLRRRLKERLNSSKNMILIIGETTKNDDDWVPFEIEYAVDTCKIPLIITYVDISTPIYNCSPLLSKLPNALRTRIADRSASAIHIPFNKKVLQDALRFTFNNKPNGYGEGIYSQEAYKNFGMI